MWSSHTLWASIHASEKRGILIHLRVFLNINLIQYWAVTKSLDPQSWERPRSPQSEQTELFNSSTGSTVCVHVCMLMIGWLVHCIWYTVYAQEALWGRIIELPLMQYESPPQVFLVLFTYIYTDYLCVPRCKDLRTPSSVGICCLQRQKKKKKKMHRPCWGLIKGLCRSKWQQNQNLDNQIQPGNFHCR